MLTTSKGRPSCRVFSLNLNHMFSRRPQMIDMFVRKLLDWLYCGVIDWFNGYGSQTSDQHPFYRTSSSEYGWYPPGKKSLLYLHSITIPQRLNTSTCHRKRPASHNNHLKPYKNGIKTVYSVIMSF